MIVGWSWYYLSTVMDDYSRYILARELGISFATVNRWENGLVKPSKLTKALFDYFCAKMVRQGKLKSSGSEQ